MHSPKRRTYRCDYRHRTRTIWGSTGWMIDIRQTETQTAKMQRERSAPRRPTDATTFVELQQTDAETLAKRVHLMRFSPENVIVCACVCVPLAHRLTEIPAFSPAAPAMSSPHTPHPPSPPSLLLRPVSTSRSLAGCAPGRQSETVLLTVCAETRESPSRIARTKKNGNKSGVCVCVCANAALSADE